MTSRLVRILGVAREDAAAKNRAAVLCARALRIPLGEATALLEGELPVTLPIPLGEAEAEALVGDLRPAGTRAEAVEAEESHLRCAEHHHLLPARSCATCGNRMCAVCVALDGGERCPACSRRRKRGTGLRRARLAVLVALLLASAGWAVGRKVKAEHRRDWKDPVSVAVMVLGYEPVSDEAFDALAQALHGMEGVLRDEYARYTGDDMRPFAFVLTEAEVSTYPPFPRAGAGVVESLSDSWALWRYFRSVDRAAAETVAGADVRVYVLSESASSGEPSFVEGVGTRDGSYGVVRAVLDEEMAVQTAVAIAHEAFHCLGATDKYGRMGHARIPVGLVDPEAVPLLPQERGELMVGEIPLDEQTGRLVADVSEVGVGPYTAREVGWVGP